MRVPPFFWLAEDDAADVLLLLSELQAAANRAMPNNRQRSLIARRCRLTKADLLVG
jgi:hypothetical protein